jgi:CheY-like chemotaxis protein
VSKPPPRPLRILVVDDEELIRLSIKLCLKSDGHVVVGAGSGEEALAKFQADQFDLVLTDQTMAGMKGTELAGAIKQRATACPVVMITAYAQMLPPTLPCVDCIVSKPFTRDELRKAIDGVI